MALGNLAQRALVAVVLLPVVIFVLCWPDRAEPTWALVFAATILAMKEFFAMTMQGDANAASRQAALIIGSVACAAMFWLSPVMIHKQDMVALTINGPAVVMAIGVIVPGLYYLFRFGDMATAAQRFAFTVTGIFYAGVCFTFLAMLRRDAGKANGPDLILLVLALAWMADTGAYFAGRFFGKSKLYPAVSPKKTWAGAIGGLMGSVAGAALIKVFLLEDLRWLDVVLIAVPAGVLGQLGDLAESLIKRAVGVKDSGAILPGHGGMLDRVDAVLFIAPYVYIYMLASPLWGAKLLFGG